MTPLEKFARIKKQVTKLQRDFDKATGALNEITKRLKKEFSCATLEEASKKLASLERREKKTRRAFEKAFSTFQRKWKEFLK